MGNSDDASRFNKLYFCKPAVKQQKSKFISYLKQVDRLLLFKKRSKKQ